MGSEKYQGFMRFSDLKCNSPKCKKCNPPKEEVMQGINHRLFSNNRSTATQWFPGSDGTRPPILINDLTPDHLAAIVDQYEGEATKFINDNIRTSPKFMSEAQKRKSPIVQEFLNKNVAAWPAIKLNEERLRRNSILLYNKLFVEKRYNVASEAPVNTFNSFFELHREEYMNKAMPKIEYKLNATISISPTERERTKARIALKLQQMKLLAKDVETATNKFKEVSMEIEKLMTQL